jgi:DNA mismatch endonuclease (patch repair protein)
MMSKIKGKDTKPELIVRRALHKAGFRYRLHVSNLPGRPDIVLPKYKTVIFVHGCFWHKHDCKYFKWPKTRVDFWKEKINNNVDRDQFTLQRLNLTGWNVLIVWECELQKAHLSDTLGQLIPKIGFCDAN